MKTIELVCSGCDKSFPKLKKEHDRQRRRGKTRFYCTRQCFGVYVSPKNLQTERALAWRNSESFREWQRRNAERQHNLADPFRVYIKNIHKPRVGWRERIIDIDITYLKELWEKQNGRCAYSGLLMEHPTWKATDAFVTASIDRIDSEMGYVRGNVQFILRALNWAKNTASDKSFKKFLYNLIESLTRESESPK